MGVVSVIVLCPKVNGRHQAKVKFFDFQIKKSKSEEMEVVPEESEAGEEGMVCSACDLKMWRS